MTVYLTVILFTYYNSVVYIMVKKREQERAIQLRKTGLSINKIAKRIGVSKSSVSTWVRNISLTDEQKRLLKQNSCIASAATLKGNGINSKIARERRINSQLEGKRRAKDGDLKHACACMLYWGEGCKSQATCSISNTDFYLLRMFVSFLKTEFNLSNDRFSIGVIYYRNSGKSKKEIYQYWADKLGLEGARFIKPSLRSANRKNKYPYGICRVSVGDVRIVQHIYGAIQEYAEMDNYYCLDSKF